MQIDLQQDGRDLYAAGPLWLATSRQRTAAVSKSVRIGLTRSVDRELRFYERGNPYVSGPKRLREWGNEGVLSMRQLSNEQREQIEKLAYQLWEGRDRPLGSPGADWFRAEQELKQYSHWPSRLPFSLLTMEPVEY
jgi:hypothetical protein